MLNNINIIYISTTVNTFKMRMQRKQDPFQWDSEDAHPTAIRRTSTTQVSSLKELSCPLPFNFWDPV